MMNCDDGLYSCEIMMMASLNYQSMEKMVTKNVIKPKMNSFHNGKVSSQVDLKYHEKHFYHSGLLLADFACKDLLEKTLKITFLFSNFHRIRVIFNVFFNKCL